MPCARVEKSTRQPRIATGCRSVSCQLRYDVGACTPRVIHLRAMPATPLPVSVSPCVDARVRDVGGVGIWKGRKGHFFSFSLSLFSLLFFSTKRGEVVGSRKFRVSMKEEVKDFLFFF